MQEIVKWTNRLAILTTFLLFYFIFAAILMSVFGLRVFQENLTQAFYASIFAMILFLAACLMLNVMGNLTLISGAVNSRFSSETSSPNKRKSTFMVMLLIFALAAVTSLLFLGDHLTTLKKEKRIINAAGKLADEYKETLITLSNYNFNFSYIREAQNALELMGEVEESFPNVDMIFMDKIDNQDVFIGIKNYKCCSQTEVSNDKKVEPQKAQFIFATSSDERAYLKSVFQNGENSPRYSSSDGRYELYYPLNINGKIFVLYLSEYSNYGKVGS